MDTPVVHPVTQVAPPAPKMPLLMAAAVILIILGVGIGWLLSKTSGQTAGLATGQDVVKNADEVGSTNTSTYRDQATGTLEAGGLNGEGTHKLIRDGGPSQTVYLVSSVIDLDQYVGKKVEVWGLTIDAVKAPWLMDVGRLKILQ